MSSPTLRELRITLNVLATLEEEVPNTLLLALSERIKAKEKQKLTRKLNRMTEEELIRYQERPRRSLRVVLSDGRLIKGRTNDQTFLQVLKTVGFEQLCSIEMRIRRSPLLYIDSTRERVLHRGYVLLMPGVFVLRKTTSDEKRHVLETLDQQFQLGWEISVE